MSQSEVTSRDELEWLKNRASVIVRRAVAAYADQSPRYGGMPHEQLFQIMAPSCREFVGLYVDCVRRRSPPTDAEIHRFTERARDRAAEGLPAGDFVDAYLHLVEVIVDELHAPGRASTLPDRAVQTLMGAIRRMLYAALDAHQDEARIAEPEIAKAEAELVESLVRGEPDLDLAVRIGIEVAPSYGVLLLVLGQHPNEHSGDAIGRRIAGRRKARAADLAARRLVGPQVLTSMTASEGVVLIPVEAAGPAPEIDRVREAVAAIRAAVRVEVRGGYSFSETVGQLPEAIEQCRRLAGFAADAAVVVLDEYLFAFQVQHEGAARRRLQQCGEEIRSEPGLWEALAAYFEHDFNRLATARALHVHPNTVDNRLAKLRSLTDLDPRTSRGLLLLGAVLAAD